MTDQRFFLSRSALIFGTVMVAFSTVATVFIGWVTYVIFTRYDASPYFLTALLLITAFFCGVCFWLWTKVVALIHRRADPVITFNADNVEYLITTGEMVSITYSEIRGVEVELLAPKYGGGHILIRRSISQIDKIYVFNLAASPREIFLAFKERLPHLLQPYSTLQRLIHAA